MFLEYFSSISSIDKMASLVSGTVQTSSSFSWMYMLRLVLSLAILVFSFIVNGFLTNLEKQKKCPCNSGWRITNGKLFSLLLVVIAGVNLFMPASKFLSSLPLVGSTYILFFMMLVFVLLFILQRLSKELKTPECKKCKVQLYEPLINFFYNRSVTETIYFTIIITIVFFYI